MIPYNEPDPQRIGLDYHDAEGHHLHYCAICGAWGGVGVPEGTRTAWYCVEHMPLPVANKRAVGA